MSESRTGEVGCGRPAADGRTVVSVSAPGGRRVGVELLVIIVSPATRTGTGAACKSGVPLLAGTSCVPVQASADATATAVIARGIFGKCILLLYVWMTAGRRCNLISKASIVVCKNARES